MVLRGPYGPMQKHIDQGMKVQQQGLILKTRLKTECVEFYKNIMGMQVLFENDFLTCFACGTGHLMVEPGQDSSLSSESIVLRLNVENVLAERDRLGAMGIEVCYAAFEWGEILTLHDPAGTKIELKDSGTFEAQIRQHAQAQQLRA